MIFKIIFNLYSKHFVWYKMCFKTDAFMVIDCDNIFVWQGDTQSKRSNRKILIRSSVDCPISSYLGLTVRPFSEELLSCLSILGTELFQGWWPLLCCPGLLFMFFFPSLRVCHNWDMDVGFWKLISPCGLGVPISEPRQYGCSEHGHRVQAVWSGQAASGRGWRRRGGPGQLSWKFLSAEYCL